MVSGTRWPRLRSRGSLLVTSTTRGPSSVPTVWTSRRWSRMSSSWPYKAAMRSRISSSFLSLGDAIGWQRFGCIRVSLGARVRAARQRFICVECYRGDALTTPIGCWARGRTAAAIDGLGGCLSPSRRAPLCGPLMRPGGPLSIAALLQRTSAIRTGRLRSAGAQSRAVRVASLGRAHEHFVANATLPADSDHLRPVRRRSDPLVTPCAATH